MKFLKFEISTILVAIAILIILAANIAKQPIADNDKSRFAGILAVVQNNQLSIDKTPYNKVGDRVVYNNISYSSKPPVLHVVTGHMIKTIFLAIKPVLIDNYSAIYRVSTILINTIPLIIIFMISAFTLKKYLKLSTVKADIFSILLVFGTLLFSYSKYLTNHIIESTLQFLLFFILLNNKFNKFVNVITGILLSALFAVDITNGVIVAPVTVLWLLFNKKVTIKNLIWIIIGAVPLLTLHFYLSYVQFENFLPPQLFPEVYLSYYASKWVGNVQGFEALNHPILIRLFNYTFGTHGLFLYQPILLIPFLIKKNWKNPLCIYTALIVIGYILFNVIMQKNYAGSAFGPRRFLPLIPIIYFFVIKNLKEYWKTFNPMKKSLTVLAFILTIGISILGYTNPWENSYVEINSQKVYFPILYTLEKIR